MVSNHGDRFRPLKLRVVKPPSPNGPNFMVFMADKWELMWRNASQVLYIPGGWEWDF